MTSCVSVRDPGLCGSNDPTPAIQKTNYSPTFTRSGFVVTLSPVFMVNQEFTNKDADELYLDFKKSILEANHQFMGFLTFDLDPMMWYRWGDETIDHLQKNLKRTLKWSDNYKELEKITVFILDNDQYSGLNGFVYSTSDIGGLCLENDSSPMNYVYLSRSAVLNNNTLTHELGHFFGLPHCYCCSGLVDDNTCWKNPMNEVFSFCDREFTNEQLQMMWNYLPYRECVIHD